MDARPTLVLHNPNRRSHERYTSLFDVSRLCVSVFGLPDDWQPPAELAWPHPANPRIVEVYDQSTDNPWLYEYRVSRKRQAA